MIGNNDKNNSINTRKHARWPIIMVCCIGGFFMLLISVFSALIIIDESISSREIYDLDKDFGKWKEDGFCCYFENEVQCLHYPDGHHTYLGDSFSGYDSRIPIAASNEKILFYANSNKNSQDFTEIRLNNYSLGNEKTILSLIGDYEIDEMPDNTLKMWIYGDGESCISINPETGSIHHETMVNSEVNSYVDLFSQYGTFHEVDDNYMMSLPNVGELRLPKEKIGGDFVSLMVKWNFAPYRCKELSDGNVLCSFKRTVFWGQRAIILIKFNPLDTLKIDIQYLPILSSYQKTNRAIVIREKLAEKY